MKKNLKSGSARGIIRHAIDHGQFWPQSRFQSER